MSWDWSSPFRQLCASSFDRWWPFTVWCLSFFDYAAAPWAWIQLCVFDGSNRPCIHILNCTHFLQAVVFNFIAGVAVTCSSLFLLIDVIMYHCGNEYLYMFYIVGIFGLLAGIMHLVNAFICNRYMPASERYVSTKHNPKSDDWWTYVLIYAVGCTWNPRRGRGRRPSKSDSGKISNVTVDSDESVMDILKILYYL